MKKFLQAAWCLVALCLTTSSAFAQCCTSFTDGPYINLNPAPCADNCATPTVTPFQVWSNEAYIVEDIAAGATYTISLLDSDVNGNVLTSGVWPAEITVAYADTTGGTTTVDAALPSACSTNYTLDFTAPQSGIILVIINEVGACGAAATNNIDNGYLSFSVDCANAPACPAPTCDAGNVALLPAQVVCLDGNITLTTDGMEDLSISSNPSYGWIFYQLDPNTGNLATDANGDFIVPSFVTFGDDPANYNIVDLPYNLILEANSLPTIPAGDYQVYGVVIDDNGSCLTTDYELVTFLDANDPACFCMPGDMNPIVAGTPQTINQCDVVTLFTDGNEDLSGNVNGVYEWYWFDTVAEDVTYTMSANDLNTCGVPGGVYEVYGTVFDDKNTPDDPSDDTFCITPNFAMVTVNAVCRPLTTGELTTTFNTNQDTVTLSWPAIQDAQAYQLAGKKQGGNVKVFPQTTNLSRSFPTSGLQSGATYQWSVRVLCDGAWTDYALDAGPASFVARAAAPKNASSFDAFAAETLTATVYPNPATSIATISLNTAWNNTNNITVVDMLGKVVAQYTNMGEQLDLDVTNFGNGYYFVKADNGTTSTTTKFVVAK